MWADSYLLWSSTIYLQYSDTGEGCLLCSHHHNNFCSYHQHLATLTSHSFRFKQTTWKSCFEACLSNQSIDVQKLLHFPHHLVWFIEWTFKLHRNVILKMFNQNRKKSGIANNFFFSEITWKAISKIFCGALHCSQQIFVFSFWKICMFSNMLKICNPYSQTVECVHSHPPVLKC